jgi:hypothetical protein
MRVTASAFAFSAVVHSKQIKWLADRAWLTRVEWRLKTAFEAAQGMLRLRVFFADHIKRQLVVLDELHARSLSRRRAA